ncbi:hypothetical protein LF41_2946 [Lysobacter dokdonensis DS-58]|uniref:Uncharacterized protein n=1 Tax=Lysobacter dokdonensis DS-58 TaxID=1300345 RepID=A0A0A2WHK9_9GAMM|nr:hypothetical protein [Lysobacter dokdonensis]KGQ19298.1 hypothetical protein LF41_2946 [Lysobacter dokdonensis DS-58]
MTRNRILPWAGVLVGALVAGMAFADSWAPARTTQYVSADGDWRLTVEPRDIAGPLEYFQDAAAGKDTPGGVPGSKQTSAVGTMEHRVGTTWQKVWREKLRNDVAPVEAIALPGGVAMTLDNWHSMGFGKDVVVLYDAKGAVTASYALDDFLPKDYVRALPRTVSSLHWRGKATALPDGKRVSIAVLVPSEEGSPFAEDARFVPVVFDLAAGRVIPPSGAEWDQALQTSRTVRTHQRALEAKRRKEFIEPLRFPEPATELALSLYMVEAFFRIDDQGADGYPETTVLRASDAADYAQSVEWVHEALCRTRWEGTQMFASSSQDDLVAKIEAQSKCLKTEMLARSRIYLVMDDAHFARGRKTLARTGAAVIQIDPAKPIPQDPERLANYMESRPSSDE